MIDPPPGMWWLALTQFISCGLFALLIFVAPRFHHFPEQDRPLLYGIGGFLSGLALVGLAFMAVST